MAYTSDLRSLAQKACGFDSRPEHQLFYLMEENLNNKKDRLSFFDFLATLKWIFVFNFELSSKKGWSCF